MIEQTPDTLYGIIGDDVAHFRPLVSLVLWQL